MKAFFGKQRGAQKPPAPAAPKPPFDTLRGDSSEILVEQLGATIAWYLAFQADYQSVDRLRPAWLSPYCLAGSRRDVVSSVVDGRRDFMRFQGMSAPRCPTLAGGKVLLYLPDLNLADGAAAAESQGFFDNPHNVPPWLLWVAYLYEATGQNYLVSWIPPRWIPLADQGLRVNPEACIRWLSLEDNALIDAFERAGLAVLSDAA